jgi:DNA-directed RNA polymerase subunit RPC12/RpoP
MNEIVIYRCIEMDNCGSEFFVDEIDPEETISCPVCYSLLLKYIIPGAGRPLSGDGQANQDIQEET